MLWVMTTHGTPYLDNPILDTDSYKASHWLQYPPGTDATFFYVESRGGTYESTVFFGLQAVLKARLGRPVTHADVDEARDFFAAHGEPFNEEGWRYIVDTHGGRLPVRVRAVAKAASVPTHQVLVTIESTDPKAFWLPSYLETLLLRLWYPVTVATIELAGPADDPALPRTHLRRPGGPDSLQAARLRRARRIERGDRPASAAWPIWSTSSAPTPSRACSPRARTTAKRWPAIRFPPPSTARSPAGASEHEVDAYRNACSASFARPGSLVAVVSDSYDIYHAIVEHWGKTLREEVIASGATVVVRPDSGDPVKSCIVA